jgi:uncharacterized glyoxalase superfamily protein PhnB
MSAVQKVKAIPEGMPTLVPHLVINGAADAIEFYRKAFDAVEAARLPGADGKLMHAMVRIGDSPLMLVDAMPQAGLLGPDALKGTAVTIHMYVEDVDATVERALAAGAKVVMPVADQFWGDRYGKIQDPFGHQWSIATHVRDVGADEIRAAMDGMSGGR